jgi:hypothetical protein
MLCNCIELLEFYCADVDYIASLIRRFRGNRREREEEHLPRPRRYHRSQPKVEPEILDDKALDLEPLQVEMSI